MLSRVPVSVTVSRMLDLLDEYTLVTSGMKGREEREMVFGKLFGLHAIVRSEILKRATWPDLDRLVADLLKFSLSKTYMKEACYEIIISLLSKETPFAAELKTHIVKLTLSTGIDNPELLWLAITCQSLQIDITDTTLDAKRWKSKQIVHIDNISALSEILKETTLSHPHSHAVWDLVLDCVLEKKTMAIRDFWLHLVEGKKYANIYKQ